MLLTWVAALAGVLTTVIAVVALTPQWRAWTRRRRLRVFLEVRKELRDHYGEHVLEALAANASWRSGDLPVLCPENWVTDCALPLSDVELTLADGHEGGRDYLRELRALKWPDNEIGHRVYTYHAAVESYDRPGLFFDSKAYRLVDLRQTVATHELVFEVDTYFNAYDSQIVLGYEAVRAKISGRDMSAAFKHRDGGPSNLLNRSAAASVITLTVVVRPEGPRFLMHWRDPALVASGGGTYHVTPAGEFEPSELSPSGLHDDLDLWRNIMREYAEEYLGHKDYTMAGGWSIDYRNTSPFREFREARASGGLWPWYLGVVMDPLTWKPEIMTVVVFDGVVYDDIFRNMKKDPEGKKMGEDHDGNRMGYPFDLKHVSMFTSAVETTPVASALLSRAWDLRQTLLAKPGKSEDQSGASRFDQTS